MPTPDSAAFSSRPTGPAGIRRQRRASAATRFLAATCLALSLLSGLVLASESGAGPQGGEPPPLAYLAAELGLTEAEVEALEGGEPVVHPPDAGTPPDAAAGVAYRVLPAPAERVFRAVADWRHYAEFFPFVLESRVLPGAGGQALGEDPPVALVEQRVDLPFPFPDRRFTLRAGWRCCSDRDGRRPYEFTWSHVEGTGNIASQEGRWRLWPLASDSGEGAGPTLVELRLASDAGAGVPDGLERRALLETLAWALDGLRQQVNRCRYDLPIHPTCREAPPEPAWKPPGSRPQEGLE